MVVTVGMKYKIRHCLKPVAVIVASCNSISKCSDNVYQGCNGIVKKHKKEIIKYASYIRYLIWQVRIFSHAKNSMKKVVIENLFTDVFI